MTFALETFKGMLNSQINESPMSLGSSQSLSNILFVQSAHLTDHHSLAVTNTLSLLYIHGFQ